MVRFLRSVQHALHGCRHAVRHERNLQIELALAAGAFAAGWLLGLSRTEWMVLLACTGLVLASELMNSAIEQLADLYSTAPDARIHIIKDVAAGAVLTVAVISAAVGLLLFVPKIGALWS